MSCVTSQGTHVLHRRESYGRADRPCGPSNIHADRSTLLVITYTNGRPTSGGSWAVNVRRRTQDRRRRHHTRRSNIFTNPVDSGGIIWRYRLSSVEVKNHGCCGTSLNSCTSLDTSYVTRYNVISRSTSIQYKITLLRRSSERQLKESGWAGQARRGRDILAVS